MAGQSESCRDVMDVASATRWDIVRELEDPFEIGDFLKELHEHVIADILKELLIIDVYILEFRVNLIWDENRARLCLLGLLGLLNLFNGHWLLGNHTPGHVLSLVHLLDLLVVRSHDCLVSWF